MTITLPDLQPAIQQLYPSLSLAECNRWLAWLVTQPNYHIDTIGEATCITKVFNQFDPPWLLVAQEVAWWGHGREAVRVIQRGMQWARLQGAVMYGYSLAPRLDIMRWRTL